jgi:predicted  nucleic acid-binding Zn-ribbon protein
MSFIKRGLGRGLEVLLADTSSLAGTEQASANDMDDRLVEAQALIENLQKENQELMSEVEALRNLLVELESMIKANLEQISTESIELNDCN